MNRNSKLAAAVLAGISAGTVAAALIPAAESATFDGAYLAPSGTLRSAPAGRRERGNNRGPGVRLLIDQGSVRLAARTADPAGGPDWVVRVFEGRTPRGRAGAAHMRCTQLGREVQGRFGWIDGANTFRPVTLQSLSGAPQDCRSRRAGGGFAPVLKLATLLDRPASPEPAVRGSVAWGAVGSEPGPVVLTTNGHARRLAPDRGTGAFIEVFGPARSLADARLRTGSPEGRSIALVNRDALPSAAVSLSYLQRVRPRDLEVEWGETAVIARSPDPGGGPSWAATAARRRGTRIWCSGAMGNLVGGHVGDIERHLGLLYEAPPGLGSAACDGSGGLSRRWPVSLVPEGNSYNPIRVSAGASAQRLLAGRTVLWGRADPAVASVTIRTPRDVRTLEPSGPAHGLMAVYDGSFPEGSAEIAVRFKDGSTTKATAPLGFGGW